MSQTIIRRRREDLSGKRFGRLLVVESGVLPCGRIAWKCACDCGVTKLVRAGDLKAGYATSCGCRLREDLLVRRKTHGKTGTHEYRCWSAAKYRCCNPKCRQYPRYGGRGIQFCERWNSFEAFLEDMGEAPSLEHSLDRIDNDKGYSPDNCRWATALVQGRNTRSNRLLHHAGKSQCIAAWAEELGVPVSRIAERLRRGWSVERALTGELKKNGW